MQLRGRAAAGPRKPYMTYLCTQSRKPHSCGADAPKPAGPCSCGAVQLRSFSPWGCGPGFEWERIPVSNGNGARFRMGRVCGFTPQSHEHACPTPPCHAGTLRPQRNTGGARFQPVGSWTGFRMGTVSGFEWERPPVSNGKGARFRTDREMRFRMAEWQFRMAGTRFRTIRGNPVSNVSAGF